MGIVLHVFNHKPKPASFRVIVSSKLSYVVIFQYYCISGWCNCVYLRQEQNKIQDGLTLDTRDFLLLKNFSSSINHRDQGRHYSAMQIEVKGNQYGRVILPLAEMPDAYKYPYSWLMKPSITHQKAALRAAVKLELPELRGSHLKDDSIPLISVFIKK